MFSSRGFICLDFVLGLWPTLTLFLCKVWVTFNVHFFFSISMSRCPSTTYWQYCYFLIKLPWHVCQRSIDAVNGGLFLNPFLHSIDLFVYPSTEATVLILELWSKALESGNGSPPNLFLFLSIILAILGPLYFHICIRISLPVSTKKSWGFHCIYRSVWGEMTS